MQYKKYIPIVVIVLGLAMIVAGGYLFWKRGGDAPQVTPTVQDEVRRALAEPSNGPKPTQAELDAIKKALSEPAPKGSSGASAADIMNALSQPAE